MPLVLWNNSASHLSITGSPVTTGPSTDAMSFDNISDHSLSGSMRYSRSMMSAGAASRCPGLFLQLGIAGSKRRYNGQSFCPLIALALLIASSKKKDFVLFAFRVESIEEHVVL